MRLKYRLRNVGHCVQLAFNGNVQYNAFIDRQCRSKNPQIKSVAKIKIGVLFYSSACVFIDDIFNRNSVLF